MINHNTLTIDKNKCITFSNPKDQFWGLSNVADAFPIYVNKIKISSAEALYQICSFPERPDVQQSILQATTAIDAKNAMEPYRSFRRKDWNEVKESIMYWCLKLKLLFNQKTFGLLLVKTGDKTPVEISEDQFWGMKLESQKLVGVNALGQLLMELRDEYITNKIEMRNVLSPKINSFLLLGKPIEDMIS